jgi:hypothetical protein
MRYANLYTAQEQPLRNENYYKCNHITIWILNKQSANSALLSSIYHTPVPNDHKYISIKSWAFSYKMVLYNLFSGY